MADEFQAGVCEGNWWNPPRTSFGSSLCSPMTNEIGNFGWPAELMDMTARSSDESCSASEGSIIIQDIQKPIIQDSGFGNGDLLIDSNLEIIGSGLSSPITTDWTQTLLHGSKRKESNYQSVLQEDLNSSSNYQQDATVLDYSQIKKDWNLKNFSNIDEDSSMNMFKPANQEFPWSSYGYPSSLLQTLFDTDPQPQDSIFGNRSTDYPSTTNNCHVNSNELSFSSFPKFSSLLNPSLPKQQPLSHLHLSKSAPYWNSSAGAMNGVRANLFSPVQSQILSSTFEDKPNRPNFTAAKSTSERVRDSNSAVKKSSNPEPAFKRARIETPLPTFKVRKEKLGDRITALQQLVSPFGKTDTASVLHEAIEYIKLLHDQVTVLSTPYMKNGSPIQREQNLKNSKGASQDLRSRGLCLVPISSTIPVATESLRLQPIFGHQHLEEP